MSKAPAPAKPAAKKTGGKNAKDSKGKGTGKGGGLFPAFLILGVGSVFVLPASIVALGGFIPTLVTALTDKSRARSVTVAVGALNLTGVAYIVIQIFQKGTRMDYAIQLLQDPLTWLIMWSGAGIGMALLTLIPPVVAQVLTTLSELKLQKLKANQAEIRKTWGEDVKGSSPS